MIRYIRFYFFIKGIFNRLTENLILIFAFSIEICTYYGRMFTIKTHLVNISKRSKGMKKISKRLNRTGFTLIEMVLVIAIIVILAAVLVFNISTYLDRAKNAASSLKSHNSSISEVTNEIDRQTYS